MSAQEAVSTEIISLQNVSVRFGDTVAVDDVSFSVHSGEWLSLIGPNGAGKTTLLRCLSQLADYEGVIDFGGSNAATLSRRAFAQQVAFVPQKPELPLDMRAIDYVALGRVPHLGYFGAEGPNDRVIAGELLERLALNTLAGRFLQTLSGGEVQRLVLARALAQEAPILLLDEPTSALDLGRRVEALELVDELRLERGITVLTAMHDLSLAAQFSDRLVLLSHGAVAALGAGNEVLDEKLLDNHFGAQVQILRTDDGELVVVPRRTKPRAT